MPDRSMPDREGKRSAQDGAGRRTGPSAGAGGLHGRREDAGGEGSRPTPPAHAPVEQGVDESASPAVGGITPSLEQVIERLLDDSVGEPDGQPVGASASRTGGSSRRTSSRQRRAAQRRSLEQLVQPEYGDGRYQTLRVLTTGGMSAILQIWDRKLLRKLILKLLCPPLGDDGGVPEPPPRSATLRFLEEATITAQLDHPSVLPVYDIGFDDRRLPYFTMRQVKGRDLGTVERLSRAGRLPRWPLRRIVGAILRACQAVEYAHARGVVHRDLKPENIMVGQFGEVYVMDWGLAKDLAREAPSTASGLLRFVSETNADEATEDERTDGDARTSVEGTVFGTPLFMPPEQALGRVSEVGKRSDVYSLGAILYTVLAGRLPYDEQSAGKTLAEIVRLVATTSPTPILELAPEAPPGLVAICEKAMARRKDERHASAAELVEELRFCLEDRGHAEC